MEATLQNAIVLIATVAALIRFALLEWEGIVHAWTRAARITKHPGEPAEGDRNEYR